MEKAILKTLIYADIFDYPMKAWEIHKWLIGKKASLQQVAKALNRLRVKGNPSGSLRTSGERVKDYYCLPGRSSLVKKRQQREKQSKRYLWKAKFFAWFLKIISTIKLIGISGGLAMNNADKSDDIDLFLVTSKNRIWLSRLLANLILDFLGIRRKAKMKKDSVAGKICINILVEEDMMEQTFKDLYVAHEVLQMKVLWQRDDGVYNKYLESNAWAFKFLPNWITGQNVQGKMYNVKTKKSVKKNNSKLYIVNSTFDLVEQLAHKFQLWYMKKPEGMERIENGALYFHPNDIRNSILKEYRQRIKTIP